MITGARQQSSVPHRPAAGSTSSPTRTGTASGTRRSAPSSSVSSISWTSCSSSWSPTRRMPRYLFDGQMAAVDDYLEAPPENEARLRTPGGRRGGSLSALGTCSWTSSSSPARRSCATFSSVSSGRQRSGGPWRSATSPTCSAMSPRCPSCSAGRLLGCGRVAWRSIGGRQDLVLVVFARRLDR